MIRFIAAIDAKRGIADDNGIPWQGKIPGDVAYYRQQVADHPGKILMGYGLYKELEKPYPGGINYVANLDDVDLRPGFELVKDARVFQANVDGDVWNLGGAALFTATLDQADELYITQLQDDFHCTKFFPEFHDQFRLQSETKPMTENGITYTFQVWVKKQAIYTSVHLC